uniref:N-alpha-acetyltransferase 30 n=1 Tax=Takifugu rubripes TaxID=31033 RepID=A0A674MEC4_TAKRU
MATVPPGPSSALPASPADISPFPTAGNVEAAEEDGEPACRREERGFISTGKKSKNMLARSSPAALHLKIQAREQQQLNGLASPSEDDDSHQHSGNREHFQHEGHMPGLTRTEGAHGRSGEDGKEDIFDHPEAPRPPSVKTQEATGPGGVSPDNDPQQPLSAEMARLDLGTSSSQTEADSHGICYVRYESELQMPWIMRLITKDLSEPYSIYTYRYFIHNWPQLCFLAMVGQECVGAIVCKLDMHKKMFRRGYIAMLAVDSKHRRKSIGTNLVKKAIYAMVEGDCDEVVLETEITNKSALKLYENLGFVRDKRLFRYYLNGVDALRLKLWLR